MIRKISCLVIAAGILITGYLAFRNLSYWERSARIFRYDPEAISDRRSGHGGFEGREGYRGRQESGRTGSYDRRFENPGTRELSGNIRHRSPEDGISRRERPDSTGNFRAERIERASISGGRRGMEGHGRGEFTGKKVNLGNVWWFLAVFAAFTVIVIYLDKAVHFLKRRLRTLKY